MNLAPNGETYWFIDGTDEAEEGNWQFATSTNEHVFTEWAEGTGGTSGAHCLLHHVGETTMKDVDCSDTSSIGGTALLCESESRGK